MKIVSYLNFSILAFSFLLVCGCTKERALETSEGVELIASLSANTKISHNSSNGVTSVSWVEGDIVGICTTEPLNLQYVAKNTASQTPLEPVGTSELKVNEGDTIVAYYPYIENMGFADVYGFLKENGVPFKGFGEQRQKEGLGSYDCLYARGRVEDNKVKLQFHHLFPILKIIFPTDMVSNLNENKLKFKSTGKMSSWGDTFYYPETQSFGNVDLKSDLMYILDADSLNGESVTCYIVMFPQKESAEITITDIPAWPNSSKTIQILKVPEGGFVPGHVYKLDLTSEDRFISDEGSINPMPECEWNF